MKIMWKPGQKSYLLVSIAVIIFYYCPFWYAISSKASQDLTIPPKQASTFLTQKPRVARAPGPPLEPFDLATYTASVTSVAVAARRLFSVHGSLVYVVVVNAAYASLTANWLCNTAAFTPVHQRLLLVCTEEKTCQDFKEDWPKIETAVLKPMSPRKAKRGSTSHSRRKRSIHSALTWGQTSYVSFLTLRAQVISAIVSAGVPLLLFETDAIWFRDPHSYFLPYLDSNPVSLPIKGYPDKGQTLTFDPLLVQPSNETAAFFAEMAAVLAADASLYDQDELDSACSRMAHGVNCETFPWDEVADGKWFKLSDQEKRKVRPLIVNNNYYVGVDNKIARQALNGFWFLNSKGKCDPKKTRRFHDLYSVHDKSK